MTDAVAISLISAVVTLISPIAILWVKNRLLKELTEARKDIDGRMTELLEVTKVASKAEGKEEAKAEQQSIEPANVAVVKNMDK